MNRKLLLLFLGVMLVTAMPAQAADDFSNIFRSMSTSMRTLPNLLAGGSYLLAIILGVMGVIKLKQHVEDPRSTPIKEPAVRFLAGGALFSLPIFYEAMRTTIDNNRTADMETAFSVIFDASSLIASVITYVPAQDLNQILMNIISGLSTLPNLLSGMSYLLGLILGVSGILTLRDHVYDPSRVPLRAGVIKLLVGGCLFALPTLFTAMYEVIAGDGTHDYLTNLLTAGGLIFSTETLSVPCLAFSTVLPGGGVGSIACRAMLHSAAFPAFLADLSYIFGIILGIWGLMKIKDFVEEPNRGSIWEGVSRLIAGGAMFALPVVINAAYNTLALLLAPHFNTTFNDAGAIGNGLDTMLVGFMTDVLGPMTVLLNGFGYVAGTILIMVGISRLMKSAQEGVRGPGGLGTIMTFIAGGALISFSPMISAFSMSLFGSPVTFTYGQLAYTIGLQPDEVNHVNAVIAAIIKFVLMLGLISFLRGIFIVRAVAEGNQQASMMSGITHLVGGAMAVNLGPFLNAVQTSLGLAGLGVNFN